jgi:hypothetical protein
LVCNAVFRWLFWSSRRPVTDGNILHTAGVHLIIELSTLLWRRQWAHTLHSANAFQLLDVIEASWLIDWLNVLSPTRQPSDGFVLQITPQWRSTATYTSIAAAEIDFKKRPQRALTTNKRMWNITTRFSRLTSVNHFNPRCENVKYVPMQFQVIAPSATESQQVACTV